jgi:Galactose oxidase, central domain
MLLSLRISSRLRLASALAICALFTGTVSLAADNSTLAWTKLAPTQALPARAAFASAYDPVSGKIVVFGGSNATGQQSAETWTFDGATWSKVDTKSAPGARSAAGMAYDSRSHKLVLFGGFLGFTFLNDTWLWDGATSTWTQADPTTIPTGATNPILFTDPANGHVDMFGGYQGQFFSRSTYQWTGTDWALLNPSNSPYPRSGAVTVLDPIHHNVVLFGGLSDNWVMQNTWTWDGSDWTLLAPAKMPPVLYFTSGGFDPLLQKVIVFGGGSGGIDQNTTWAWDGSNWYQLLPAGSPPVREQFGTVWDQKSRKFLIFGGTVFDTNQFFGDTWQLTR